MKKLVSFYCISFFLLTSCTNTIATNSHFPDTNSETKISSSSIEENSSSTVINSEGEDQFNLYQTEINEAISLFRNALYNQTLEIESRVFWGSSAEGAEITQYKDAFGTIYRYTVIFYGETGNGTNIYYPLPHKAIYAQQLISYYSAYSLEDFDNSVFGYELYNYIQDGSTYIIMDETKTLTKTEDKIYSLEELNEKFETASPKEE